MKKFSNLKWLPTSQLALLLWSGLDKFMKEEGRWVIWSVWTFIIWVCNIVALTHHFALFSKGSTTEFPYECRIYVTHNLRSSIQLMSCFFQSRSQTQHHVLQVPQIQVLSCPQYLFRFHKFCNDCMETFPITPPKTKPRISVSPVKFHVFFIFEAKSFKTSVFKYKPS